MNCLIEFHSVGVDDPWTNGIVRTDIASTRPRSSIKQLSDIDPAALLCRCTALYVRPEHRQTAVFT